MDLLDSDLEMESIKSKEARLYLPNVAQVAIEQGEKTSARVTNYANTSVSGPFSNTEKGASQK